MIYFIVKSDTSTNIMGEMDTTFVLYLTSLCKSYIEQWQT